MTPKPDGVKIGEIPGCLLEKLPVPELKEWGKVDEHLMAKYCAEHGNAVIDLQGEVKITLNRERLAEKLWRLEHPDAIHEFDVAGWKAVYYDKADAIIADLKSLLEVVKPGEQNAKTQTP